MKTKRLRPALPFLAFHPFSTFSTSGEAAIISSTYSITATGFINPFITPPFDTLTAEIAVTFDTTTAPVMRLLT